MFNMAFFCKSILHKPVKTVTFLYACTLSCVSFFMQGAFINSICKLLEARCMKFMEGLSLRSCSGCLGPCSLCFVWKVVQKAIREVLRLSGLINILCFHYYRWFCFWYLTLDWLGFFIKNQIHLISEFIFVLLKFITCDSFKKKMYTLK